MAPSAKHLSFLILLFLISSLQIQARESHFFSKFSPNNNNHTKEISKPPHIEAPAPSPEPSILAPEYPPQSHNGYGLYGHGSGQFTPTTTTTNEAYYNSDNFQTKTQSEEDTSGNFEQKEFNGYEQQDASFVDKSYTTPTTTTTNGYESKQEGMSDTRFLENGRYSYTTPTTTTNGYETKKEGMSYTTPTSTTTTNNGYENKQQGMSDTRFLENGRYSYTTPTTTTTTTNNGYENKQQGMSDTRFLENGRYSYTTPTTTTTNNNNGYETKKQGMSDTRFVENGRYYHDVSNENNYRNGYESERGSNEGFGTSKGVDSSNQYNNGGYYGNNENSYESNNSMENYQNQEEYQESQEQYVP